MELFFIIVIVFSVANVLWDFMKVHAVIEHYGSFQAGAGLVFEVFACLIAISGSIWGLSR